MNEIKPLNLGLFRVHRIFMVLYGIVCAMFLFMAIMQIKTFAAFAGLTIMAALVGGVALGHWYAMKGTSLGKPYGRKISRMFGCLWLIGFPVGTALAIYVFVLTSDSNWTSDNAVPQTS